MTTNFHKLYTPVERAVLSNYFGIKDPKRRDLAGIDVSTPVDPDEWDEAADGIAPVPSEMEREDFMLENTVARICLESIRKILPQWLGWTREGVGVGRKKSRRRPARRRTVRARHLFTINWADSGPGFNWPEAYHVARLPGYDLYVVTASNDSPEVHGYSDVAIGWFRPSRRQRAQIRTCITDWWTTRQDDGQERWASFLGAGSISETTANKWADAVWPDQEL